MSVSFISAVGVGPKGLRRAPLLQAPLALGDEGIKMGNVVPLGRDDDGEISRNPAVRRALALMKEALAILDAGGAGFTTLACHLSLAIDRGEERPLPQSEEEAQAMLGEVLASTAGTNTAGKF